MSRPKPGSADNCSSVTANGEPGNNGPPTGLTIVTLDNALEAVHRSIAIDRAWRTFKLLKGAASVLKIRSTLHTQGDSWTTILSLREVSSWARSPGEMLRNSAWIC